MAAVSLSVSTVKPLGDRIFVKVSESEEKTAGGILLPDTAKEKPQVGEVVQVGPGKRNDDGSRQAPEVGVGDKVLYSKYAGTDIKLGGDVKFSDVPNGVQALFKIPAVGLLQILLLIGILETQFPNVNGDYGTGYFGQSLEEPLKSRKLAIELANGRLAMLAIMGLLAQDVVTGGHPLAGPNFGEGGFVSL